MLMTAGDKDSLNVTASCPHAACFSYLSDFSLHKTDAPHELASFCILLGVCNHEGTQKCLHSNPKHSYACPSPNATA